MSKHLTLLLVLSCFALAAVAPDPPAAGPLDRLPPEQKARLEAGEIVYDSHFAENESESISGWGQARVIVKTPADECFRLFCDFGKHYEFFPRMTVSRVDKREGDKVWVYKELDFGVYTMKYVMLLTVDPARRCVDFREVMDENSEKDSGGYFLFEKIDGQQTLFTYRLNLFKTSLPVPDFLKDYLLSRDLPDVAGNVKKRIESGGKWTK